MLAADDVEFFALLASSASLAEAARRMNVTPSAVTQRLQGLEARLGAKLVDRTGGPLGLTDEGELVASGGRRVMDALNDLREALARRRSLVVGRVRVAAPFGFGRRHIAPLIAELRAEHPDLVVDLVLSDRPASLGSEAYDIAFHVGPLDKTATSLTVRKLAPNNRLLCASPAYIARRGEPEDIAALVANDCIALHESMDDGASWRLRSDEGGAEQQVRVKPSLATNDGEVAKSWALAGLGIVLRSEWDVAEDLRSGRLQRVLGGCCSPAWDVVALLPARSDARPARVRILLDRASEIFAHPPWR